MPKEYEKIYKILKQGNLTVDEISRKTNTNIIEVNTKLTMLELEGYIERMPGNVFKINVNRDDNNV